MSHRRSLCSYRFVGDRGRSPPQPQHARHGRERGLLLIEAILALVVLGVLGAMAVPTFRQFTSNTRVSAATNGLASALARARNEAFAPSTPVSVCAASRYEA